MMHITNQRGFTLVETLVSILLLTMTIVLPYVAIQRSLNAAYTSRDDLIASSLAQEAVEYVRWVRDNNYLSGNEEEDWLEGIDGGTGERDCFTHLCTIDATYDTASQAVAHCLQAECADRPLYMSSTNLFTQESSAGPSQPFTQSRFTRYVELEEISDNVIEVRVTVKWNSYGGQRIIVTDILTNWL